MKLSMTGQEKCDL